PEGRTAHVAFAALPAKLADGVRQAVEQFAEGPSSTEASLVERAAAVAATPREEPELAPPAGPVDPEPEPLGEPEPREETPDTTEPAPETGDDRRTESRHIFTRRVVALREDMTRVLIGRDLSPSGMRTDPDPKLQVGDELSVALPLRADQAPTVVRARVFRDEGDRGLVLQFVDLSEAHAAILKQHANLLPICDSPYAEEEPAWVIVSEVVDA
ncbi:MAG: PilZ domain-containing protein, partial [Myxococcota bacterium]